MIRRAHGSDYLLITQHDHALIAGELAESFGNDNFASPIPREQALLGVSLHDCGWPLHDDEPTLNADSRPLDVFESPRDIAFKVWTASVERAAQKDHYAGLLVSLHVLSLSVLATEYAKEGGSFDMDDPKNRFAVVKFQQREIERQEDLRVQLGLRSEKTPHKAAVKEMKQGAEDQLQFNFALLQVMDQISLAACCTEPPTSISREIPPRPGEVGIKLVLARNGDDVLVDPWPFAQPEVELKIPACRIPARKYRDNADLRSSFADGCAEVVTSIIRSV